MVEGVEEPICLAFAPCLEFSILILTELSRTYVFVRQPIEEPVCLSWLVLRARTTAAILH